MKYIIVFLLLLFSTLSFGQNIPDRPSPPRLVNDFVGVLSADQKATLEQKLVQYNDSTSSQIAVVILKSTGDYGVDQVALKILRDWGVGSKEKNNGVVLLVAVEDRRVNIQTGYGMEGVLPDAICKRIISNDIAPYFKQKQYFEGLDAATLSIAKYANGEYTNDNQGGQESTSDVLIFLLILFFVILFFVYSAKKSSGMVVTRRGSANWDGGGWWYMPGGQSNWGNDDYNPRGGGGGGFDFGGFGGGDGGGGGASGDW